MFDLDQWQEILGSIRRHKLRTALTALGVFWGIFMLVILLAAGRGLQNGMEHEFRGNATNTVWVSRGTTSIPYNGLPEGRQIRFSDTDYEMLARDFEGIRYLSSRFFVAGNFAVRYQQRSLSFNVRGVHAEYRHLENLILQSGRFINETDLRDKRKVAVIGKMVQQELFGEEEPLGKAIHIGNIVYQVVGTYIDEEGDNEMRIVYIPLSTAQAVYAGRDEVHQLMFSTYDLKLEEIQAIQEGVRQALARRHEFDPDDRRAVHIYGTSEEYLTFMSLFAAIRIFVWFIGLGSILAGIIGVSNIMLITVKDRTREIGIRKALGATPRAIVGMILQEALLITAAAGYLGLLAGTAAISLMEPLAVEYFRNPRVDLGVGLAATLVLIAAGLLAGLMPARQAAKINPAEAMRGS
jgi:putative ABC transport system permease protein